MLVDPPVLNPTTYPVEQVHEEMAVYDPLVVEQADKPATNVRTVEEVADG